MSQSCISQRQADVLNFCQEFFLQNDTLPTRAVVAEHFGWASANAAQCHMEILERCGFLEKNALGKYKFTAKARPKVEALVAEALE